MIQDTRFSFDVYSDSNFHVEIEQCRYLTLSHAIDYLKNKKQTCAQSCIGAYSYDFTFGNVSESITPRLTSGILSESILKYEIDGSEGRVSVTLERIKTVITRLQKLQKKGIL